MESCQTFFLAFHFCRCSLKLSANYDSTRIYIKAPYYYRAEFAKGPSIYFTWGHARIFLFIREKKNGNSLDNFEDFGKSKKV